MAASKACATGSRRSDRYGGRLVSVRPELGPPLGARTDAIDLRGVDDVTVMNEESMRFVT